MPNVKDFYPGATAGNPINNSTASVSSDTAIVSTNIDDQNQTPNALVWTGTAAEYTALVNAGTINPNTLYFVI